MNNETTAKLPLQPVGESSEVLTQLIEGTITRETKNSVFTQALPEVESYDS